MTKRYVGALLAVLVVIALLAAQCGGSAEQGVTATSPAVTEETPLVFVTGILAGSIKG